MSAHRFSVLPGRYAVVRLGPRESVPGWAASSAGFVSITRTLDELSIVCPEAHAPAECQAERGWAGIKLHGPIPFSQVGVLASFVSPLEKAGVSVFALSTFDTDYIFVKAAQLPSALAALTGAGHGHVG